MCFMYNREMTSIDLEDARRFVETALIVGMPVKAYVMFATHFTRNSSA